MPRGRISPRTKKTARPKRAGKGSRRAKPAGLLPLQIANRTYAALKDQPVLITPELKQTLEKRKLRDGTRAFDNLVRMGFRGGKHLLELIREQLGPACQVVLSHEDSAVSPSRMIINYETFRQAGQQRFFEVYRQTGLLTATQFLNDAFPETFTRTAEDSLPEVRDVKRVLRSLPQAAEAVPRRDRAEIPDRIAELVERQGAEFAFSLLSSVDAAIPRGQEQIRARFQEVVGRLASEPKALAELTALMDEWNLLQVTSLLSVLKTRLNTIATFETLISDEGTYELKGDKSIHRTLERSMWLLNDEYWIAQSNKSLRTLLGKDLVKEDRQYAARRRDFDCVDALGKRTVLVEIKRPSIELRKAEVDQAELYLRLVRKHQSEKRTVTIYLIGNVITPEARELAEMRRYPTLWTYTDLIESARQRYQEYLRIVETED